jgi:hypothetical protein
VPLKRILAGMAPEVAASRDSLANPEALDAFVALAAQRVGRAQLPESGRPDQVAPPE